MKLFERKIKWTTFVCMCKKKCKTFYNFAQYRIVLHIPKIPPYDVTYINFQYWFIFHASSYFEVEVFNK